MWKLSDMPFKNLTKEEKKILETIEQFEFRYEIFSDLMKLDFCVLCYDNAAIKNLRTRFFDELKENYIVREKKEYAQIGEYVADLTFDNKIDFEILKKYFELNSNQLNQSHKNLK